MRVAIPSRGRANSISKNTLSVFPDALVCVAESEADAYRAVSDNVITHPDDVSGMGPLRQWMLDNLEGDLFMVDDDVDGMFSMMGAAGWRRITDPRVALAHVENTALCAREAGAHVFGCNQGRDARVFRPTKPISLTGWVGGAIGVIGRDRDLRYEPSLLLRADIDYCLQSLRKHRIIWQDARFSFSQIRFTGSGGNAINRSGDQHAREIAYLQRKWGAHLQVKHTRDTVRLVVKVTRTSRKKD